MHARVAVAANLIVVPHSEKVVNVFYCSDVLFLHDSVDGHVDAGKSRTQVGSLLPAQSSSRPPHCKDYGAPVLPERRQRDCCSSWWDATIDKTSDLHAAQLLRHPKRACVGQRRRR